MIDASLLHELSHTRNVDPSDIILNTAVTFDESDDILNITSVEIPKDLLSEKRKQFRISIASIEPSKMGSNAGSSEGALTSISGEAIELVVYDNDCESDSYK